MYCSRLILFMEAIAKLTTGDSNRCFVCTFNIKSLCRHVPFHLTSKCLCLSLFINSLSLSLNQLNVCLTVCVCESFFPCNPSSCRVFAYPVYPHSSYMFHYISYGLISSWYTLSFSHKPILVKSSHSVACLISCFRSSCPLLSFFLSSLLF